MPEPGAASAAPQVQLPPCGWKASAIWPPDVSANNSGTPAPDTVTAGTPVRDDGPPEMTCQPLQAPPLRLSTAAVPPVVRQKTSTAPCTTTGTGVLAQLPPSERQAVQVWF